VEVFEEGHRTGVTPQLTTHVTKIFQHAFHKVREGPSEGGDWKLRVRSTA
jgi:hypothetical protein